jgi:hypothetical protein
MAKTPLMPRSVPIGVGFGSRHSSIYMATRTLLEDVQRAEQEAFENVEETRRILKVDAVYRPTIKVQTYSAAVQVFAAMTAEAAIDMYAVMRFGEANIRNRFSPGGIVRRLKQLLQAGTGADLDDHAEILVLLRRLVEARNALVHPKSDEVLYSDSGEQLTHSVEPFFPGVDGDAARDAFRNLNEFYRIINTLDPAIMLIP